MHLAVLTDIHGNLPALEAVLEDISKTSFDAVVVAGDSINMHPDSKACWDLIQNLGFLCLRGNHERYIFDYASPQALPEWQEERFKLLAWMHAQFTKADLLSMRNLPLSIRLEHLLITHASPLSDQTHLSEHTTEQDLAAFFPDAPRLIIRGHQHRQQTRLWSLGQIITIGSLGFPLNEQGQTQYLSLRQGAKGWSQQHHLLDYDRKAALRKMDLDYLENAGPLGEIFRLELKTARAQVMPFFHRFFQSLHHNEINLASAVKRYIADSL